jgi:2-(1,2-epoxy-1,2-dihydrophenyl)acetyl-CoA isomerase
MSAYVGRDGRVLRLAIASNAMGSAIDLDGTEEWISALEPVVDGDTSVGAVLLTGGDRNFCAGGNVKAFAAADDPVALLRSMAGDLHRFMRLLVAAPVPVVAAVPGWAAGAGMSVVCATDISIGGPSTGLRPGYPQLGFSPDGGLSWTLPRVVGATRAREILLTDRPVQAEEALRIGLISRLVDSDEEILGAAERVAAKLAAGPTTAYRSMKRLLAASPGATYAEQLDAEEDLISWSAGSPAGREGVQAFVGKRKADFSGTDVR